MKHGQKLEEMYDTTAPKNEIIYPSISIPSEVFKNAKCQIGEKYTVEVVVEIRNMDEYSYGCKLLESEIEEEKKEDGSDNSVSK